VSGAALLLRKCCDPYRRARRCSTGNFDDFYLPEADVDFADVYVVQAAGGNVCMYFDAADPVVECHKYDGQFSYTVHGGDCAACLADNPGPEPPTPVQPPGGETPPCACPGGLAGIYTFSATVEVRTLADAHVATCTMSFPLTGPADCSGWLGGDNCGIDSIAALLSLDTTLDPNCFWKIIYGLSEVTDPAHSFFGLSEQSENHNSADPVAGFSNAAGVGGGRVFKFTNVQVS
jgi:hypothetical protein